MKRNELTLELCEQMETLSTKCRVANTELSRDYTACQACALYIKAIYYTLPINVKQSTMRSNRLSDIWNEITDHNPGLTIDRDTLDNVERYVQNPIDARLFKNDRARVYKLLEHLSKLAHDLVV